LKNKHKEKQNHREEKRCKEGGELSFKLPFCALTFGSCFYPPAFAFLFQTFSLGIFLFSRRREGKKKTKKKKTM
jgi:hypothetical protein